MKALTPTPMICTKIGSITPSVVHVTVDFFGAPVVVGMFLRCAGRASRLERCQRRTSVGLGERECDHACSRGQRARSSDSRLRGRERESHRSHVWRQGLTAATQT